MCCHCHPAAEFTPAAYLRMDDAGFSEAEPMEILLNLDRTQAEVYRLALYPSKHGGRCGFRDLEEWSYRQSEVGSSNLSSMLSPELKTWLQFGSSEQEDSLKQAS